MTFSCEMLPTDAKAAIREMKAALREQLSDVQQVFDTLSAKIETRVAEIDALKRKGCRFGRKFLIVILPQVQ